MTSALGDLAAKRIMVSDLETRLMTQTARGNDFERALNERQSELSDERLRLAELARRFAAEQERGLTLEPRIRELESERDEAQDRLGNLGGSESQNDELRRQISEVAAQIMKSTAMASPRKASRRNHDRSRGGKRRRSAGRPPPDQIGFISERPVDCRLGRRRTDDRRRAGLRHGRGHPDIGRGALRGTDDAVATAAACRSRCWCPVSRPCLRTVPWARPSPPASGWAQACSGPLLQNFGVLRQGGGEQAGHGVERTSDSLHGSLLWEGNGRP